MERTTITGDLDMNEQVTTRWLIGRDIEACAELSYRHAELSWLADDFRDAVRNLHCIGYVAIDAHGRIRGVAVIELCDGNTAKVLHIASDCRAASLALSGRIASRDSRRTIIV